MSARSTRKRARLSSEDRDAAEAVGIGEEQASQCGERKRDEEFWYEDGNVILIARDVEFRVFKGILSDHSPVFKDMFSLPQPEPPHAAMATCPVVHVTDTPEDLRHLLRVYMPKTDPSPFMPDDPSFDMISATIRLGDKYQITKLVDHSVDYLKLYYTDDYTAFSKRGSSYWPPSFEAEHAIGVVNLARLTDEPRLLPVAFLICCTLGRDIVRGFQREDGSWEQLSLDDIGLCFAATRKLLARRAEAVVDVFDSPASLACKDPNGCRAKLQDKLHKLTAQVFDNPDPFDSVLRTHGKGLKASLCSSCWTMVKDSDAMERENIWANLPRFFGLVPGDESTEGED